jgi:hypothetical protein
MISTLPILIRKAALTLALGLSMGSLAALSSAQDFRFRDGRFLETLGGVTLQRADEASSDEAVRNMPFLPGDRVWTDDSGRAEIVFAEGEILWVAERSKVDSLGRGGREQDERLGLRVFAGSFGARVRSGGPGFEFRAPGGSLTTAGAASFRVDVRAGETVVSVSEGEVLTDFAGERMTVRSGERIRYADQTVDGPFKYQRASVDSFDRWCEERSGELSRMASDRADSDNRLPDELDAYDDELGQNGEWVYDEPQGYVYVPRVASDWAPYTYGRWVYTLYGWTWVADEPWGFVTSHYGRWGYSSRIGWHWMPRTGFAGAWVGWSTPVGRWSDTIGWCALGFNDRPVGSFASYGSGGRAVPRGESRNAATGRGWSFTNRSDMGRASVHRNRVEMPESEAQRAVVWNQGTAPDRQFRETRSGADRRSGREGQGFGDAVGAVSRGQDRSGGGRDDGARIYVRPSPGDSTPELRSDPTTTIPSPESRRGRTIGQDGFKDEQNNQNNRRGRTRVYGSSVSMDETATPPASDPARQRPVDRSGSASRPASTPVPTDESARAEGSRERPTRDPLLSRFFRSITSPDRGTNRETSPRGDDGAVRRREPSSRDDSSTRESTPRERSRPETTRPVDQNPDRERSRPAGADRPQPRNPPPPQASPRGGGSEEGRASRRRPPQDH